MRKGMIIIITTTEDMKQDLNDRSGQKEQTQENKPTIDIQRPLTFYTKVRPVTVLVERRLKDPELYHISAREATRDY